MTSRRSVAVCWFLLFALLACLAISSFAKKKPPLHPVNLNSASALELQQVPGIGPSTADKILMMRKSYGTFKSVDDLLAIKGLGPKKLEKMRKYLTVGKTPQGKKPASGAQAAATTSRGEATAKRAAPMKVPVKPAVMKNRRRVERGSLAAALRIAEEIKLEKRQSDCRTPKGGPIQPPQKFPAKCELEFLVRGLWRSA